MSDRYASPPVRESNLRRLLERCSSGTDDTWFAPPQRFSVPKSLPPSDPLPNPLEWREVEWDSSQLP